MTTGEISHHADIPNPKSLAKDLRDARPMAYAGRVIGPLPSVMSHMENKEWLFKDSSLVKLRRTLGEPKQIPAKNMIQMETVGGNALPDAAITNTHGAQKFAQLGGDCASTIISSALDP